MTNQPWVVYGAGGHGKVVAEILFVAGRRDSFVGFIDDDSSKNGQILLEKPVLGTWDWMLSSGKVGVVLGIGSNRVRELVAVRCVAQGHELITAVHPSAVVSPSASLGAGTVVMALAVLNADARAGRGVIVNTAAVVEHDVVLGDFSHVSPNAALGGAAALGARSQLGLGGSVLPGVQVADDVLVGAGAVVVKNLPPGVVAVGVPARALPHRKVP